MKTINSRLILAFMLVGVASVSCSAPSGSAGSADQVISIDGSSTVYPITDAIANDFLASGAVTGAVEVSFSGTGDGFEKFCAGETVVNNASRPISEVEMEVCRDADIRYFELPVGFDAITIAVNPENTWAEDITVEELKLVWADAAQRNVTAWNEIRSDWPNRTIALYGPGTASGTYDYFTEVILGKDTAGRSDYIASEDDELLVNGISQDPNALGYFGFAYYEENQDALKSLGVDSGEGPVAPSREAVERGQYHPLSRPLFIYVNAQAAQENPTLQAFVEFYLENAPTVVQDVGYVPLPQEGYEVAITQFYRGKVGTVFDGQLQPGLTIRELLSKRATF
ncbi:MAG: PstS family phosphate ABC transporter substrate-binding protein [Leptolyngbya sp. SIO1D8]|nr:PstS family phosphate ABC transporter substrate-binding protein [Leptolyngbya sp. SIO1D8]